MIVIYDCHVFIVEATALPYPRTVSFGRTEEKDNFELSMNDNFWFLKNKRKKSFCVSKSNQNWQDVIFGFTSVTLPDWRILIFYRTCH
jgi:hypothetical protein